MDLWTNTTRVWSRGWSGLGPIRVQMKKSKMEVIVESNNAFLYRKNDELPTRHLRFAGFHSGAIWMEKDVIGEYYMNSQGKFEITEIENGFKIPGSGTSRTPWNS